MGRSFRWIFEVNNQETIFGNYIVEAPKYSCNYSACGLCIKYETICKPENLIKKFLIENSPQDEHDSILNGYV